MCPVVKIFSIVLLWILLVAVGPLGGVNALLDRQTGERISVLLNSRGTLSAPLVGVARLFSHEQILELYQQREYRPVWTDGWLLKPEARSLIEHLREAGEHGLCGNDYLLAELEGLIRIQDDFSRHNLPLSPNNRAVLDLFLSQAFLTLATHMVEGQVDPALSHVDWNARRRKADLVKLLEYVVRTGRIATVLDDLLPPHEGYRQLVATLDEYQTVAALGGWPKIPPGPSLRLGDVDERVHALRNLLMLTGDLNEGVPAEPVYDDITHSAMKNFQLRHGLVDDGVVGPKSLLALNVPIEKRMRQIELNLERWRWMPKDFGARHVRINVADFLLEVMEQGVPVLSLPVIVGTKYRKTPIFSSRITYLEFAPYWTVPPTILREDKLPKIMADPSYLQRKHFKVLRKIGNEWIAVDPGEINWSGVTAENFPGMLRMEPGPWNPLGRVKFMFPNGFNVYLHDTNERYLFSRNVRSFSSGCIRVEKPEALAEYLLGVNSDSEKLSELFAQVSPSQVSIRPIPVHIQYWTAWVGGDGKVNFRPDVYLRDLDLDFALSEPRYRVLEQLKAGSDAGRWGGL